MAIVLRCFGYGILWVCFVTVAILGVIALLPVMVFGAVIRAITWRQVLEFPGWWIRGGFLDA